MDEKLQSDKVKLGLFWIKEDSNSLPDPDVLADAINEDLQNALDQFTTIASN